jgi:tungstate transport system substrate-binding protein
MKKPGFAPFILAPVLIVLTALHVFAGEAPSSKSMILSTTTSTQDSGLLDVLVPLFEKKTGYSVKTASVGTGQALELAARGEADVALVHAPSLEKKYVADGKLLNRRLVMYNDFVIIGPQNDPAKIKSTKSSVQAMKLIADSRSNFVSRGDNSGTHNLEKALWKQAAIEPKGAWYIESGQGMGATLGIANEKNAYTITDRATYLAFQKRVSLPILLQGDKPLLNIYSVMEVNPANGPRINTVAGKAFADFMVAPETQAVIKNFGMDKYGQALFVPVAGKREEDLGG